MRASSRIDAHDPRTMGGGFDGVRAVADCVLDTPEDQQRALLRLAARRISATFSLDLQDRHAAIKIARAAGRKPPRVEVSARTVRALGRVADVVTEYITRRPPPLSYGSVCYTAGRHLYFSNEKARRELGYSPRPLDEAIRSSVEWFRSRS